MSPRLTNKERRAETRRCLMASAARVFSRDGLDRASIDRVAEDAGYTKGAFYANFKSKRELFLAMLDERFSERMARIEQVVSEPGSASEKLSQVGNDVATMLDADPESHRLFLEFSVHANRDEEFREELLTRYQWLRERLAALLQERTEPPHAAASAERMATMTIAIANGFALESLLEPEAAPKEMLGAMLTIFFAGVVALAPESTGESLNGATP